MFDEGPDHRSSSFRPQRERFVFIAISERVHLLRNDVGLFSDTTAEQLGCFEDGRADFAKAIEWNVSRRRRSTACQISTSPGSRSYVPFIA